MVELEKVNAFDMYACALAYIKAAAEAGGTIDMYDVQLDAFETTYYTFDVFLNKYMSAFGEVQPDPTEEEEEQIRESEDMSYSKSFTLNEAGWKVAEQIRLMEEATKAFVPTQEQVDCWMEQARKEREDW